MHGVEALTFCLRRGLAGPDVRVRCRLRRAVVVTVDAPHFVVQEFVVRLGASAVDANEL